MGIDRLLLAAAAAALLSGCGQKGPLVLPEAQHPHKRIGLEKIPVPPAPRPLPATHGTPPADATQQQ